MLQIFIKLFLIIIIIASVSLVGSYIYKNYIASQELTKVPSSGDQVNQQKKPTQSNKPQTTFNLNHIPDTPEPESELYPTSQELQEFKSWANTHGIILQGTKKPVYFWTALDYKVDDENVDLSQIKGVTRVYVGLKLLPDDVLDVIRGKTIYFSTTPGRSTTTDSNSKGLNAGIFLAATTIYTQAAVHEFGHLFETYAIGGGEGVNPYPQNYPHFNKLLSEYRKIFPSTNETHKPADLSKPVPAGYISHYATTNSTENFAEHFAYYVIEGDLFRQKATNDPLLQGKYNFFKDKIFKRREY